MENVPHDVRYKLWYVVILHAQLDAFSRLPRIHNPAREWLTRNHRDFALICEFAGFTREETQMLLEQHQNWERRGWRTTDKPNITPRMFHSRLNKPSSEAEPLQASSNIHII